MGAVVTRSLTLAGLILVVALPAVAHGTARVSLSSAGNLSVTADHPAGSDGNHGIVVEPFVDGSRSGFRVRQQASGDPTITSSDSDCTTNAFFNDVVCNGPRSSASVEMGDGNDNVTFFTVYDTSNASTTCFLSPPPGTRPVTVSLGDGDDVLEAVNNDPCGNGTEPQPPVPSFPPAFTADGGRGADTLRGGFGRDILTDGQGADALFGNGGNDELHPTLDNSLDTFNGGDGVDVVDYHLRTGPLVVSIGDPSTGDGQEHEHDFVANDVENVIGGSAGDTITGNASSNRLEGRDGGDTLVGGLGNDTLIGGPGDDVLTGGFGVDSLDGGPGDDHLSSFDGIADSVSCGDGNDTLSADLRDPTPSDCENVTQFAVDDGPPSHAVGRRLHVGSNGTAAIGVACPRRAHVRCRGTLTLRRAPRGRVLARARYNIRLGGRVVVDVHLPSSLRRGARVSADTKEQGVSRKGPRSSRHRLVVR